MDEEKRKILEDLRKKYEEGIISEETYKIMKEEYEDLEKTVEREVNFYECFVGALTSPKETFKKLSSSKPRWDFFFIMVVLNSLLLTGVAYTMFNNLPSMLSDVKGMESYSEIFSESLETIGTGMSKPVLIAILFIEYLFLTVISYVILAGVVHIFASIFGGKGNFENIVISYPFATLPTTLLLVIYIFAFTSPSGVLIASFLSFISAIWTLILLTIMIRENHRFSTGKAILSWLIPFAILIIVIFAIFLSIFGAL